MFDADPTIYAMLPFVQNRHRLMPPMQTFTMMLPAALLSACATSVQAVQVFFLSMLSAYFVDGIWFIFLLDIDPSPPTPIDRELTARMLFAYVECQMLILFIIAAGC